MDRVTGALDSLAYQKGVLTEGLEKTRNEIVECLARPGAEEMFSVRLERLRHGVGWYLSQIEVIEIVESILRGGNRCSEER